VELFEQAVETISLSFSGIHLLVLDIGHKLINFKFDQLLHQTCNQPLQCSSFIAALIPPVVGTYLQRMDCIGVELIVLLNFKNSVVWYICEFVAQVVNHHSDDDPFLRYCLNLIMKQYDRRGASSE
jgi:hypothetical protein